jgi:hypothetical protein
VLPAVVERQCAKDRQKPDEVGQDEPLAVARLPVRSIRN